MKYSTVCDPGVKGLLNAVQRNRKYLATGPGKGKSRNVPYPARTGPSGSALFTSTPPAGVDEVSYLVEAENRRGNISHSSLARVVLA